MSTQPRKVGGITIGQSPRADMVPEILEILGPQVEVVEGGALDGLVLVTKAGSPGRVVPAPLVAPPPPVVPPAPAP